MPLLAAIEAGGTKFICAVGTGPRDLRARTRIETTTPAETLARVISFFLEQTHKEPISSLGIGSFGPVDPNPTSPTFGYIITTPKPGWANTDLAGTLQRGLGVPVGFDTDVNAAALGESRWGAARELSNFVYLTIGTGIGGGGMLNGELMHGLVHPEMGHIRVPRHPQDSYAGKCPFHKDCFEGLASGPALEARWGIKGEVLLPDHPAWELEAFYLGEAIANIICTLSPERIMLGGGVMQQPALLPRVRAHVQAILGGYIKAPAVLDRIEEYIVSPALGGDAGILGAFALAERAARSVPLN